MSTENSSYNLRRPQKYEEISKNVFDTDKFFQMKFGDLVKI